MVIESMLYLLKITGVVTKPLFYELHIPATARQRFGIIRTVIPKSM